MEQIGYQPSNPITAEDFADPEKRETWRRDKGFRDLCRPSGAMAIS
jgi:hypothetical protein